MNKLYIILFTTTLIMATPSTTHKNIKDVLKKKTSSKHLKVKDKNKSKKTVKTTKKVSKKSNSAIKKGSKSLKEYKVKSGDTVFSIGRKFKVSISDIYKTNKLKQNSTIFPGQSLQIPSTTFVDKAKKAIAKNNKSIYKVKSGDTISSIAKKFKMKTSDIIKINNIKKSSKLSINQELNVYSTKKTKHKVKKQTKYIVKSGDSAWSIAKKFNLNLKELKLLNPKLSKVRSLKKGLVLNVSKDKAIKLAKNVNKRKKRLNGTLAKFRKKYPVKHSTPSGNRVVRYAKNFLGRPYVWGASSGRAFDCSGFTQYVVRHAKGRAIPRVSRRQAYYGKYVSRRNLRASDLVFFDTSHRRRGYVNHVGMYIGNHKFIHASSAKHRVVITSLNKPFYSQRFMWGRRIY